MKIGIEIEIETPVGYLNRNRYFQFRFRFDSQKGHSEKNVLGLGVREGKVHRVRLVDVDRYVQHKTFPCTHYTYNLPRYVYEYVLFISIDGFVNNIPTRKYNHTSAYKYMYFTMAK
jgi:hypothetical protein